MREIEGIKKGLPPTAHLANAKREKQRSEADNKKHTQKDPLFDSSGNSNSE
jgi:hypothetical protein